MKHFIVGTATGAIVGAALSAAIPCNDSRFKNKILKKGKKARSKIIKNLACVVYKMM